MGKKDKKIGMMSVVLLAFAAPALVMGLIAMMFLGKVAADATAASSAKVVILVAMVILVVASVVGGQILAQYISKLVGSMGDIASGAIDLQDNKLARRDDVIGKNVRTIGGMMQDLARVVTGIDSAAGTLDTMSDEFKVSFEHMSDESAQVGEAVGKIMNNTTSQSEKTVDIEDKIARISQAVDVITENVRALTASAKSMRECNDASTGIMAELIQISKENIAAIENVRTQADLTNQSAMEIHEATEIISGIASQTNLLALNASIEAARAGENGKGFAVVAEEIRVLADQSKESSGKISSIVNRLIGNSNDSVENAEKVSEASVRQNDKIHETEEIFRKMNEESISVSNAIVEINNEVQDLDHHKNVIGEAIVTLSEAAEQNTASAELTVEAMRDLEEMVAKCKESTEQITDITKELVGYIGEINTASRKRIDMLTEAGA